MMRRVHIIACCNALYVIICEISKICKTCYKCGSTTGQARPSIGPPNIGEEA